MVFPSSVAPPPPDSDDEDTGHTTTATVPPPVPPPVLHSSLDYAPKYRGQSPTKPTTVLFWNAMHAPHGLSFAKLAYWASDPRADVKKDAAERKLEKALPVFVRCVLSLLSILTQAQRYAGGLG